MIVVISLIDFFLSTKTRVKKRILKILRKKIFSLFCLLFYFSTQMMMRKTARIKKSMMKKLIRFLQGTNLFAQSRDFHQGERVFAKVFFRRGD